MLMRFRFQENRNGSFVRLLTSRDGTKTRIQKIRSSIGMTVIPFITANGTTLLVVYILPWMSKKSGQSRKSFLYSGRTYNHNNVALHSSYIWTAKGWLTLEVWKQIIQLFIKTTRSYFNGQVGIMDYG